MKAPEFFQDGNLTFKRDNFAFGVIALEMLTDVIPFEKLSLFDAMTLMKTSAFLLHLPPIDDTVPVKKVVEACLHPGFPSLL